MDDALNGIAATNFELALSLIRAELTLIRDGNPFTSLF